MLQVNSSLSDLSEAVTDLISLYNLTSGPIDTPAVFLSQLPLEEYHKAEEKFTQQLTAFTKKQFFEVSKSMVF